MSDTTSTGGAAPTGKSISLPAKIVISLRVGFVLAAANILCVVIFSLAWIHVHSEPKEINVTGSAKKQLNSDLIVWTANVTAADAKLENAYSQLQASTAKVSAYLAAAAIPADQITVGSIQTTRHYAKDEHGHDTQTIDEYELSQSIEVTSPEVDKVAAVGRNITSLIQQGTLIDSDAPKYIYTHLADLKIAMLAEATKDATARAQQIAGNSGAKLGSILDARMGVMQINPVNSNDVSDSGNNDTTSRVKEITAVVTARFSLQ